MKWKSNTSLKIKQNNSHTGVIDERERRGEREKEIAVERKELFCCSVVEGHVCITISNYVNRNSFDEDCSQVTKAGLYRKYKRVIGMSTKTQTDDGEKHENNTHFFIQDLEEKDKKKKKKKGSSCILA